MHKYICIKPLNYVLEISALTVDLLYFNIIRRTILEIKKINIK